MSRCLVDDEEVPCLAKLNATVSSRSGLLFVETSTRGGSCPVCNRLHVRCIRSTSNRFRQELLCYTYLPMMFNKLRQAYGQTFLCSDDLRNPHARHSKDMIHCIPTQCLYNLSLLPHLLRQVHCIPSEQTRVLECYQTLPLCEGVAMPDYNMYAAVK